MIRTFFTFIFVSVYGWPLYAGNPNAVTVTIDGKTYSCSEGGAGGISDPQCITKLTSFCTSKTNHNGEACYKLASKHCKKIGPNFFDCVSNSGASCISNTNLGGDKCLDEALAHCK